MGVQFILLQTHKQQHNTGVTQTHKQQHNTGVTRGGSDVKGPLLLTFRNASAGLAQARRDTGMRQLACISWHTPVVRVATSGHCRSSLVPWGVMQ